MESEEVLLNDAEVQWICEAPLTQGPKKKKKKSLHFCGSFPCVTRLLFALMCDDMAAHSCQ